MTADTTPPDLPKAKLRWYRLRFKFVLILTALAAFVYWGFQSSNPQAGSGPAGPAVPAEPCKTIESEQDILLVSMGDSVVTGFGARAFKISCSRLGRARPLGAQL